MEPDDEKTILYAIYVFYIIGTGNSLLENVHSLIKMEPELFLAFLRLQNQGYLVGCVPTLKALDEVEKVFDVDGKTYGYERACKLRNKFKDLGWSFLNYLADRAIQIFENRAQ